MTMSTVPSPEGLVAVIWVSESTEYAAVAVPNVTAVAPVKLAPVMVTAVPPETEPASGEMAVTTGAGTAKVNWSAGDAEEVPAVVTVTSTVPAPSAGVVAVTWVSASILNAVALPGPNFTAPAPVKADPVMTTDVPPVVGPVAGLRPVTCGGPTVAV